MSTTSADSSARVRQAAVIIVNYNSGEHLTHCLEALNRQTTLPGVVVVVDNNSDDGSLVLAQDAQRDAREHWKLNLVILAQDRNLGFASANNLAARYLRETPADGQPIRWLILLNPDAFAYPDWLARLLDARQVHSGYTMFASRLLQDDDPNKLDGAGDCYHTSGVGWRRGHGQPDGENYHQDEEVFAPCAAAAMYCADAFHRVGGFDDDYFCYFEDLDLGFRLRLSGERCLYVAAAKVRHVGSATTGKQSNFSVYYGHRNLVWTYLKNMPSPWVWWYLPSHLLINMISLFYFARRGQFGVICRAKWHALRGAKKMLTKRSRVQRLADSAAKTNNDYPQLRAMMSHGMLTVMRRSRSGR